MASRKRQFAVNVGMNWAATAVSMVVPFFLIPFVVRHLGAGGYGVWILVVSTTAYLGLLDLGLRSAIIRFVSKAHAQNLLDDARQAIGAALWFRAIVAVVVAVLAVVLAWLSPHFFKIPPELMRAAQITMFLSALGVAVTLISGVFGAVLAAVHRFDLLSSITMAQTIFRAIGVLLILHSGRGLVSLAVWELTVISVAGIALTLTAFKVFPASKARIIRPTPEILKPLWSYSLTTFVFIVAVQVIWNTDSLVIGALISVGMVTFYSIGSSLVSYSAQVAGAISTTFTPMASGLEASGRKEDLQKMLIRGTQAMLGFTFPIAIALAFRGRTFIGLWMGPQYAETSEVVLQILMISLFFSMADSAASAILMAIDKHGPVARWAVYEAILNFGLSILLAKPYGIYGVAWGTSISMAFTHLAFYPRIVNKTLGVPTSTYLWEGWGKVSLCSIPFAFVCAYADRAWHASNLLVFFAQILLCLPAYLLCIFAMFRRDATAIFLARRTA